MRLSKFGALLWFFWALLSFLSCSGRAQQTARPIRVLVLYWDDRDHPFNIDFARAFRTALESAAPGGVEYYAEYLESTRFPGVRQAELLRDYILAKYAGRAIDVVVANGAPAVDFLFEYRSKIFQSVPIVFVTSHPPDPSQLRLGAGATGVIYVTGYRQTLDLALKLHPGTKRVFILSSTLASSESWEQLARGALQGFHGADITYLTDLPLEELKTRLRTLPQHSIVLYVWERLPNRIGKILETTEVLAEIAPSVRVPMYGMSNVNVGRGIVGGYVWTTETRMQKMAELIFKVTKGARAADIPVENAPIVPVFDWRELQRWGIPQSLLPPDSVIRFRELTFWQQYKSRIAAVGLVLLFQTILIGTLLVERRRALRIAAALQESEARFRNMADTAPVLIWVSGPDKLCTFFNKAWLTFAGRSMEQELGNGWAARLHPDDLDRWSTTYSFSFSSHFPFQMEYRLRGTDGEYRSFLCAGVPRFKKDGGFAGYIGSSLDITDLKRAQETVLVGQKLESMGQLASGIAHDFNNLLGGILTSAELALTERAESLDCDEELLRIKAAALAGAQIVRELMIFGARDNPAFEPVDCSLLAREMIQVLKVSISKSATLTTDLADNLGMVYGNAAQIRQLIMNLVINASQAIGERKGKIRVATRTLSRDRGAPRPALADLPEDDYLELEVSDTGSGMTEDVKARIFDPFFTTKREGRGLGLAVVQGIVRTHGGAINVASAPGAGTRIRVFLPCMATGETADDDEESSRRSSGEYQFGFDTILIIEDEELLRQAASKLLRRRGFTVIEAADGIAGIELFLANQARLGTVLLDMTLPGKTGAVVLNELQRIDPDVKVILTSAYGREQVQSLLGGLRACGYIQKPYRLAELEKALQKCADEMRGMGHTAA